MNFSFVIPYLDELDRHGVDGFLNSPHPLPDHALLAARWYYAAKKGDVPLVRIEDCAGDGMMFLADYFFFNPAYKHLTLPRNCVQFSAWSLYTHRRMAGASNSYVVNHLQSFSTERAYCHSVLDAINSPGMVVTPLGGMQQYCLPRPFDKTKSVFLDEPHRLVLEQYGRDDLQHVYSYKKALSVCRQLHQRGYEIVTFCSTNHPAFDEVLAAYPFLRVLHKGSRVNYFGLLDWYRSNSIFWSHHQETHGYPVYENLQMGNPVITFCENFNILTTRQFQNSVVLSLYFSDRLCVEMVEEFFGGYTAEKSRLIQADSARDFSADTFADRLRRAVTKFGP